MVDFYKTLADETRLAILVLIVTKGEQCVCDITTQLDLSQPKISRHLATLRSSGVLASRRDGQWVYYQLSESLPHWCMTVLSLTADNSLLEFDGVSRTDNPCS